MNTSQLKEQEGNIFLRMHPLHRILLSVISALVVYLSLNRYKTGYLITGMISWDVFALIMLISSWVVLFSRPVVQIRKFARKEDGSKLFVFLLVLISSFASLVAVLLLLILKEKEKVHPILFVTTTLAGMLLAWLLVHTIFAFHYAHIFYDDDESVPTQHAAGLNFPGEKAPNYLDFAYFSFVIGMTFQVSDVVITSRRLRRLVLLHALLAFALNTFVVALTINLISGLKAGEIPILQK